MIDYGKVKAGDKLKIVGAGAPGFAKLGDIVEVVSTNGVNRCDVKRADGETAYFALTCGAHRLELVEETPMDDISEALKNTIREAVAKIFEDSHRSTAAAIVRENNDTLPAIQYALLGARITLAAMREGETAAARDVLAERRRQIAEEGWTPEHDNAHSHGQLAGAAAAYITGGAGSCRAHQDVPPAIWPWSAEWWKPSTRRRDLVKAAALLIAEIERLDRVAHPADKEDGARCFICGEPFKPGDMVLPDINEGLGHRACFGDDREGFVNLNTGDPIGPDEPLPTGWPYSTPPAPGGE